MSRPWTKNIKTNFRIELEWRGYGSIKREEDYKYVVNDLNKFFQDHKDMDDYRAFVNSNEITVCIFCDVPYEEYIDEKTGQPVCAYCGKGAKEAMMEKLDAT